MQADRNATADGQRIILTMRSATQHETADARHEHQTHGSVQQTLAFGTVHFGNALAQLMDMYAAKQALYALSDVLPTCRQRATRYTENAHRSETPSSKTRLGGVCGRKARDVAVHGLISQICKRRRGNRAEQTQRYAQLPENAPATRKSAMVIGCSTAPKQL